MLEIEEKDWEEICAFMGALSGKVTHVDVDEGYLALIKTVELITRVEDYN